MRKYSQLLVILIIMMPIGKIVAQEAETVITFEVGDFKITTLSEGQNNGNSDFLIGATQEMLQKYLPEGPFPLEINAFLVQTPDKTILIDAGVGKNLFDNLQSLNVPAEQINVILLTHMHGDHIGGLLCDGKVAFPNADLYISQAEHDYWMNEQKGEQARRVITAYQEKLHLFIPDELGAKATPLLPGFQGIAAYGHTPGHTAYLIESGQSQLLIWGDITHATPIQMPHPEVALSFDSDSKKAIQTRKNVLEYVLKSGIPVGGMHIVFPSIGNIVAGKLEGYEFVPFCTCLGI